jgi:hypothetical protein
MTGKTTMIINVDDPEAVEFDKAILDLKGSEVKTDRTKLICAFIRDFNKAPKDYVTRLGL